MARVNLILHINLPACIPNTRHQIIPYISGGISSLPNLRRKLATKIIAQ